MLSFRWNRARSGVGRASSLAALIATVGACGSFHTMVLQSPQPTLDWRRETGVQPSDPRTLRFIAVGDAGDRDPDRDDEPHPNAKLVASKARAVCAEKGCDFGIFLGDNVYPAGIDPTGTTGGRKTEAIFRKVTDLYKGVGPLYFVLGNHDWGPTGLPPYFVSPSTERARRELALIAGQPEIGSPEVRGRSHFYDFSAGPAHLFVWDTNYLVQQCQPEGAEDVRCEGGAAADRGFYDVFSEIGKVGSGPPMWRIVAGHHPYLSNGEHGNAGSFRDGGLPLYSGEGFRRLFKRHVEGQADLYLSGHDHNLQAFHGGDLRGTAIVVSGAGSKANPRGRAVNEADLMTCDKSLGFALVEATRSDLSE